MGRRAGPNALFLLGFEFRIDWEVLSVVKLFVWNLKTFFSASTGKYSKRSSCTSFGLLNICKFATHSMFSAVFYPDGLWLTATNTAVK